MITATIIPVYPNDCARPQGTAPPAPAPRITIVITAVGRLSSVDAADLRWTAVVSVQAAAEGNGEGRTAGIAVPEAVTDEGMYLDAVAVGITAMIEEEEEITTAADPTEAGATPPDLRTAATDSGTPEEEEAAHHAAPPVSPVTAAAPLRREHPRVTAVAITITTVVFVLLLRCW